MMINSGVYSVGIYIRLSREDDDKSYESESITNQKSLLLQYTKENKLNVYDIYIDDGYSGTNFDRPGFNRMMEDIKNKKINMVITKDMSRLGRDYIGTGNLIEKFFPENGIRYIAVTDNIDTYIASSNNDIAPFKAIMNDMYAKDISKKIKSSLRAKQKEGKWVSGRTPFGYDIDPNNKNHLVINKEQALIVKRIYNMFLSGMTYYKIALELTNNKVKTPAQFYNFEWRSNYNLYYGIWHSKSIEDILKNRIYIGDLVQNKRNKINYKVKKIIRNKESDYIVVENTHEPIIDKDTFYKIQELLPKYKGRIEKKENHLFDGLLYCGDCGHRISVQARRKKNNKCYTVCNYYRTYIKKNVCTTHSNNYDKLEKILIDKIKESCKDYIDSKKIKDSLFNKSNSDYKNNILKEINLINSEIERLSNNLDSLYIDKLNKIISVEQFDRVKEKLINDLNLNQKRLYELQNIKDNNINSTKKSDKYIEDFIKLKNINRDLIVNLVDKVEIFNDKKINLKLSFKV